jgi:hypothetical protein
MSVFEGPPDMLDEGVRHAREVILPQAKEMDPGFKGIIALTDHQSGKMLGITFWESEEALRATEEGAKRLRGRQADAIRRYSPKCVEGAFSEVRVYGVLRISQEIRF